MNSSAKNLLLEKARSLLLDAVGCMSCPIAPQLSEKLEKAGPVPFAPAEIEKRLAPEEILADTKSIAVILFPYRYPEEKNANIALYARAKDYHHVVRAYLAKIIGYMEEQYPNEKFHAITDTSPMADRWLAYQAGLGFFGRNHCLIHRSHTDHFGTSSGHPACNELRQLHPLFRGMPRKSAFPRTVQSVAMQIVPHAKERSLK